MFERSGSHQAVPNGRCSIGVIGSLPVIPDTLAYDGCQHCVSHGSALILRLLQGQNSQGGSWKHTQSFSRQVRADPRDANSVACRHDLAACRPLSQAIFAQGSRLGRHVRCMPCARIWKGAPCVSDRGRAAGWFDAPMSRCGRPSHRLVPPADGLSIA